MAAGGILTWRRYLWGVLVAVAVVGGLLRCHDISRQILLNDEWHSLERASRHDLLELSTTYYRGALAIPLNVYNAWVLRTFGWSELTVRLPSLAASLVTLLFLPWAVLRTFRSTRMAIASAVLFALSPFWIFYGQNGRPYALYLLSLLACYAFFHRGLRSTSFATWTAFAVSGALAAYFHLYALPAVGSLALLVLYRLVLQLRRRDRAGPTLPPLALAGRAAFGFGLWSLLLAACYLPAYLRGVEESLPTGHDPGPYDARFWSNFVELLTGATNTPLAVTLTVCALAGVILLFRKHATFVLMLVLAIAASTLLTLIARPKFWGIALVILRYDISIFILYFVGMSRFVQELASRAERAVRQKRGPAWGRRSGHALLAAFALSVLLASPTPRNLAIRPNNFSQHSAFTEYYRDWDPSKVAVSDFFGAVDKRSVADIPAFYARLKGRGHCRILEYPLIIEDHYNPLYFYQMHHHCEVLVGYSKGERVGKMLNVEKTHENLDFRQMVWVDDLARIKASGAEYLIVHVNEVHEARARSKARPSRETRRVLRNLKAAFGPPEYRDRYLRVFRIRAPA